MCESSFSLTVQVASGLFPKMLADASHTSSKDLLSRFRGQKSLKITVEKETPNFHHEAEVNVRRSDLSPVTY